MTAPEVKMFAYHLGIVVHDLEAACTRYSELLGVPEWHRSEVERPALPINPKTRGGHGKLHIAFGRVPGMTFELIQPEGRIEHKVFLDERGEGVQHIGVWTPDVQTAVREAVAKGCRITHAALSQDVATIDLMPDSPPDAIIPYLGNLGYVDAGVGGFQIEFVAATNPERHRDMFQEITDETIALPPWYQRGCARAGKGARRAISPLRAQACNLPPAAEAPSSITGATPPPDTPASHPATAEAKLRRRSWSRACSRRSASPHRRLVNRGASSEPRLLPEARRASATTA